MQPHLIISSQTLIETNSVQQAELLQKRFHEVWNSREFLNRLDKVLSSCVSEKEWVVLDKLELDLTNLSLNISDGQLKDVILEKVGGTLKKKVSQSSSVIEKDEIKSQERKVNSDPVSKVDLIHKFTETWEAVVLKQFQDTSFLASYLSLNELFVQTKKQFEKEGKSFSNWILVFFEEHKGTFSENLPIKITVLYLSEAVPEYKAVLFQIEKEVLKVVRIRQEESGAILKYAKTQLHKVFIERKNPKRVEEIVDNLESVLLELSKKGTKVEVLLNSRMHSNEEAVEKEAENPSKEVNKEISESSLFVDNAGMAIVFPYLSTAFKNLGYTDESELEKPSRAIHFLSFLETGQEDFAPHRTALYKVICGQAQGFWVDPDIVLSNFEKDEAQQLLESVIGHWGALKNSSPEGLREAFLRRKGKLSMKDFDFNLKVESRAQDILLTRIPWGFGTIKLPWMTNFLHVDW